MARTVEQIIQEQLGAMVLQSARLIADLEAARERIAALEVELKAAKAAEA